MNSLLKSVHLSNKKNTLIREGLQYQLGTSVLEMQSAQNVLEGMPVDNCNESMSLCSTLEAIFLHGLKDSLLNRVTEAISGPDLDAMPQPSFWGPLLVFSHRQIIDQITSLSQISTEVGYCRVWIRLALNEGLLASYLSAIKRENSALKPYYSRAAFIRDVDLVEVVQRHIESLDYVKFNLACNSSLLNFWSSTPLMMAAVWSPPMKNCPVNAAVDIAKTIQVDVDITEEIDTSSLGSYDSFNSSHFALNRFGGATEDDALNIILGNSIRTVSDMVEAQSKGTSDGEQENSGETLGISKINENEEVEADTQLKQTANDVDVAEVSATGNSLIGRLGWSTSLGDSDIISSQISNSDALQTPGEGLTYDSLIQNYQTTGYLKSQDMQDVFTSDSFEDKNVNIRSETQPEKQVCPANKKSACSQITETMDLLLGTIAQEQGLDSQNYSCKSCGHLIGLTFAKAHVCTFTGHYFCSSCMMVEEAPIPARIVHNWDFNRYPVSLKAANYLNNCRQLIDLKETNMRIYSAVDCMAQLQNLRIQLNLLGAYLFTCREPIIESLQKQISPRDYLYETVHKYSIADLLDAPSGALAQQLQKIVEFAKDHVLNCWLCSQKGFICEICSNPKVIYPFNMKSTYRCPECNAVFHADCLNASKPCPKCERRRKRVDLPLLNLSQSDITTDNNATTSPICIK